MKRKNTVKVQIHIDADLVERCKSIACRRSYDERRTVGYPDVIRDAIADAVKQDALEAAERADHAKTLLDMIVDPNASLADLWVAVGSPAGKSPEDWKASPEGAAVLDYSQDHYNALASYAAWLCPAVQIAMHEVYFTQILAKHYQG